ncbi:MAG: helix-turn-helix domain-containing protein [Microbacteriaceae bacterium]
MAIESLALHNFEDRAAKAISRRNLQINPRDLVALLADLVDTSAPTTQPDRDFLTTYAGLTDADLTDESVSGVDASISVNRARASVDVQMDSLTTQDVAQMLNMDPANVRRAVTDGTLYSVKPTPGSHHRFPKWQFVGDRALPGMREVISALPDDYHPLEVARFIAEPAETLRNMSPAQWLAGGGNISDVVALADGRSWE